MVHWFDDYRPLYDEESELPPLTECEQGGIPDVKNNMTNTTSTIATSFNQKVNTDLIQKYLKHDDIKVVNTKFLNQVTLTIRVWNDSGEERNVNTKIFTYTDSENKKSTDIGTVHMTGAKTIKESKYAIEKLINAIKSVSFSVILDGVKQSGRVIYAVDDIHTLTIDTMVFKYFMHNSVFELPSYCYGSFYNLLKRDGYDVSFNPNVYAGVILKMVMEGVNVSYILFRSGKTTTSIACPGDVCVDSLKDKIFNTLVSLYMKYYYDIQVKQYKIPKLTTHTLIQ